MEDMPPDYGDFPVEVQEAFNIYNLLPSRIAEFSGVYLGKNYGDLGFFFEMREVEKEWQYFLFQVILMIDSCQIEILERKRKEKEATSKQKGK